MESIDALGQFILDGDFADVMAAGLGAIYSLLPSKLRVPSLAARAESREGILASSSGGMTLGASVDDHQADSEEDTESDLPLSTEEEVRSQLDLLLKLFSFLQDVLARCKFSTTRDTLDDRAGLGNRTVGVTICHATLTAIQASFLDHVLYPSMSECSSADGSAVAVMTCFNVIFANLNDGPLLERMIVYLLTGMPPKDDPLGLDSPSNEPEFTTSNSGALLNETSLAVELTALEHSITLKDVILDNIRCSVTAARLAALRLMQTLLSDHCGGAAKTLLSQARDSAGSAHAHRPAHHPCKDQEGEFEPVDVLPIAVNSTDQDLLEVELYSSLISRIDPLQTSAEITAGYASYLSDMESALQAECCFCSGQSLSERRTTDNHASIDRTGSRQTQSRLSPSDPLIRAILQAFGQYFCRTSDESVALTGVLTTLALCPNRSIAGWLTYDFGESRRIGPQQRNAAELDDNSSDDSLDNAIPGAEDTSSDPFSSRVKVDLPAVYQILRDLVRQVNRFRLDVDDFDRLLSERRQGLLFADHLDEAMDIMLDVEPTVFGLPSTSQAPMSPTKRTRAGVVGTLKSFLTPQKNSTPSSPGRPSSAASFSVRDAARKVSPSPFKTHYEQISGIALEARPSIPIATGPWSPAQKSRTPSRVPPHSALYPSTLGDESKNGDVSEDRPRQVGLSAVLDNCVILEEFLKEIISVITARRALGIDQVGFI